MKQMAIPSVLVVSFVKQVLTVISCIGERHA